MQKAARSVYEDAGTCVTVKFHSNTLRHKFAVRGGVTPRSSVDVAREVLLGKNPVSLKQ